ncbi:MAG: glycerophosphodiester phosphodiesterase family protein [Deltaproteobacteria bacterium]|nr:glycerophosphodiester phosphodiesterase family protein [Deltaproteobacteria bacterium]
MHIMGHRGAPVEEPENTRRSIRRALEIGVDAVEVDVHLSKDGRLVVIHDDKVDRTTNGKGRVKDLTFAELRRLDAGKGERLPSLEEVMDLVIGRAHLIVEVKAPEAGPALVRLFQERDIFQHAHVISFWHPLVKTLKEQEPRLRTGVLMVGCPADPAGLARAALAEALVLNYAYVNPELVTQAHAHDLLVYVWNIDDIETLKPYLTMNLDGIGTNRPDVVVEYVKKLGGGLGEHNSPDLPSNSLPKPR